MKKFRKFIATIIAVFFALILVQVPSQAATITSNAAPTSTLKYMDDGNLFDPVYYRRTYYQVYGAFINGKNSCTDLDLYNYYVMYGKALGQVPYKISETPTQIYDFKTVKKYEQTYLSQKDRFISYGAYQGLYVVKFSGRTALLQDTNNRYWNYQFSNCSPFDPNITMWGGGDSTGMGNLCGPIKPMQITPTQLSFPIY